MKKIAVIRMLFLLLTFASYTSTTIAQPSWSRGEQLLSITFQEAMLRANAALKSEGFVNLQTQANIVTGYKGVNTAIILCNDAQNGKQWINIVVASLSDDGSVPGADRVKLQERMNSNNNGNDGSVTANTNNKWRLTINVPQGQPYPGTYILEMNLTEAFGKLTGSGTWSNGVTSNLTGENSNGNIVLYRTDSGGFRATFWGKVIGNGTMEGTGQNDPTAPSGNNASFTWIAIKL